MKTFLNYHIKNVFLQEFYFSFKMHKRTFSHFNEDEMQEDEWEREASVRYT